MKVSITLLLLFCAQLKGVTQKISPLFPIETRNGIKHPDSLFNEVKQLILSNYYSLNLAEEDLYWAAIKGMLRHVSPPENPTLATIITAEQYEKVRNRLKGQDVSIGIKTTFNSNDGSLIVNEIQPNSPSQGILEKYDRIMRIDGSPLKGLSVGAVNKILAGPEGSDVSLTVVRDIETLQLDVSRDRFSVSNLIVTKLPDSITALVEIKRVYAGLSGALDKELAKLDTQGVSSIILDLRNNTGGVLNEGIKTANLFLKRNNIVLRTVTRSDQPRRIVASIDGYTFGLAVLMNGKTASAAEIIAHALQDHKRAKIIGSKSYGKGVIETTYKLSNDYRVKFITSAMYSPAGKSWQAKGILPDYAISESAQTYTSNTKLPIGQRMSKDVPLSTALKLLKE